MTELGQIGVALIFHVIDMVSGLISAVRNKDLNSAKMRDGLFKKIGFVLCYVLAFLLDTQGANIGFHIDVKILPIIIVYAVTTEVVSIIENICEINPDLLPEKLKSIFHIEEKTEEKGGETNA